jgi:threonine dehydrogenase-like Zn-dependent dehydrogenase
MFSTVYATDLAEHRFEDAVKHGAIALPLDQLRPSLLQATGGKGADAVIEAVGHESALKTALDLVRAYGVISSCGLHTRPATLEGTMLYGKK